MVIRKTYLLIFLCALGACQAPATPQRQFLQDPAMAALKLPFSDSVLVGNTLYLSGAGGFDPATGSVPAASQDEVRLLMENVKASLARAGMTMADVVSVTIYCSDLTLYNDFNAVYKGYFDTNFPARAFIGSGPLLFGMHFEMQAIAVKR